MLTQEQRHKLISFARALIDQKRAQVAMEPMRRRQGYWFGGGNLVEGPDGAFYLTGRYRNYGDSRAGLEAGTRGVELAIFVSHDRGRSFTKALSFTKPDLALEEKPVLSIEGSALHFTEHGVELFVSSEKDNDPYPRELRPYQKPGTGIWSIERLSAGSVTALASAKVEPLVAPRDPQFLHVKDPLVHRRASGGLVLGFCTHPFSWTSSNSAYTIRQPGETIFDPPTYDFFRRGFTWDVAISRITCYLRVPRLGSFSDGPNLVLAFYDGGESMRRYEEHEQAIRRPRGYSCEEIGGLAVGPEDNLTSLERLSVNLPLFVSPGGTGCSRYVDVLQTEEGFYATWQQGQSDGSQPLVMNFVDQKEAEQLLT
ncbi:MAG: exo-alpha-sialidase [Anaerolineae bacterium]